MLEAVETTTESTTKSTVHYLALLSKTYNIANLIYLRRCYADTFGDGGSVTPGPVMLVFDFFLLIVIGTENRTIVAVLRLAAGFGL